MRVVLLRHGRAGSEMDGDDRSRRLTGEGVEQARRAAYWMGAQNARPDACLCSDAIRAEETAQIVLDTLGLERIAATPWPPLYDGFTTDQLIGCLTLHGGADSTASADGAASPARQRTVLVVGHNPLLTYRAHELLRHGLPQGFPTGGLAIIDFDAEPRAREGRLAWCSFAL